MEFKPRWHKCCLGLLKQRNLMQNNNYFGVGIMPKKTKFNRFFEAHRIINKGSEGINKTLILNFDEGINKTLILNFALFEVRG